ncbi:matrix metalloproteinase-28 isoform X2 [Anguilla anguilla]|uniref:matrix metalloproteinase-28 isoform X2 n=1 Tax=Anguilla anguilla TaxID=7936 RepID=UPI0015AFC3E7|nr:matrix metalloproteinase-28 isoform X2 [Anguilla anguilla]
MTGRVASLPGGNLWTLVLRLLPLLLVKATIGSPVSSIQPIENFAAEGFLEKYGYLHQEDHRHNEVEVSSALREFQWLSHLPVTGHLDGPTLQRMSAPRCGVKDAGGQQAWARRVNRVFLGGAAPGGQHRRSKRYTRPGEKWYKRHLTYRVVNWPRHLPKRQVELAVRTAFQLWSNVSALAFREVAGGPADIRLAFYAGEHNDGTGNAFDGPGKPPGGQVVQLPGQVFSSALQDLALAQGGKGDPDSALPLYCQGLFDAITVDQNGSVLVFRGGLFWTVSAQGDVGPAQPLRHRWPQLPLAIEAAAFSPVDRKFYFFKGRRMWRYSGDDLDPGFPKKNEDVGLPAHPDCAFFYAPLGHMVLFKGSRYFVLNLTTLRPEPYYPRGLADWKGVPRGANGALGWADGRLYFFRAQQFWRFDPGKVRVTGGGQWAHDLEWAGCQEPGGANDVL